jgi:hypothetical protein
VARLILDTGAVLGFIQGNPRVAAAIRLAHDRGDEIVVPSVVVAQSIRGGPRDAPIHRLLHSVFVPFIGLRLARRAGELLGTSGTSDAADALIMAEALRTLPALILTGDPDDMHRLADGQRSVRVVSI